MAETISLEPGDRLTAEQAARLIGISTRSLARLAAAGAINPIRLGRTAEVRSQRRGREIAFRRCGKIRYTRAEIERYLAAAAEPWPPRAS